MKKLLCIILAVATAASLTTTAFAYQPSYEDFANIDYDYYQKFKDKGISINVYNWGEYISNGSDDSLDINKEFEALTGIKVYYSNFATNEELYAKLKGGAASYDIIIPSDYLVARMIREDMLQKINLDNVPNFANIYDEFKFQPYDPTNEYSVPYTWGTVGIIYNKTMVDENDDMNTWNALWNEKYMGEILMFSNPRDAFGIALKKNAFSMNTTSADELEKAAQSLKDQKILLQAYVMDEIFDKMSGGEAAIAPYYAGDAITMIATNPDLAFASPVEGVNRFLDAICIPKGAQNTEAAEMYINFLCEPEIGAANAEYIGYSTPNMKSFDLLDEDMRNNKIAYPDDDVIAKSEFFNELPEETNLLLDRLWTDVLTSDEHYNAWFIPIVMVGAIIASISINVGRSIRKKRENNY